MSTQSHPAASVQPLSGVERAKPRPAVALGLALLSLPGVALLWDLVPAGGLTIGLPLAVAGLLLGLQARRARPSRIATAAVVLSGLALLQLAICVPLFLLG